jgi:hypothetical protein
MAKYKGQKYHPVKNQCRLQMSNRISLKRELNCPSSLTDQMLLFKV